MSSRPDQGIEELNSEDEEVIQDVNNYNSLSQSNGQDIDHQIAIQGLQGGSTRRPHGGLGSLNRRQNRQPTSNKWVGFSNFPKSVQAQFKDLFQQINSKNKEIRILVLGKIGVGKTSTIQSLLNEKLQTSQTADGNIQLHQRTLHGFTLKFYDTPGLTPSMILTQQYLTNLQSFLLSTPIDLVLYVDRLDEYRVTESDEEMVRNLRKYLGCQFWDRTMVCLTHSNMSRTLPSNLSHDEWTKERVDQLNALVSKHGGIKNKVQFPYFACENSGEVMDSSYVEKSLPESRQWVAEAVQKIVENILQKGKQFELNDDMIQEQNINRRRLWLIPVAIGAQILIKIFFIDRVIDLDQAYGNGEERYSIEEQERNLRNRDMGFMEQDTINKDVKKKKKKGGDKYYTDYF